MEKSLIQREEEIIEKEMKLIRKEIRILFNFHYKKMFLLTLVIITAYFIFSNPQVSSYISSLNSWGYLGVFIAGLFFTFGFSTPLSVGFFVTLNPENIWLAAVLGGFAAMLGDLVIFKFIRFSFMDEFERIKRTTIVKEVSHLIDHTIGHKIKVYLLYAFAGILIASPLPDEAAIIILAGLTKIKATILIPISLVMNTAGILIFLII